MDGKITSPDQLTEREHAILERLANGLSDQQIADELFLSLNTVKWYNRQIYSKLGVSNRTEAATHATALVSPGTSAVFGHGFSTPAQPPNNLPAQMTTFVGRHAEITEVSQLLENARLLSLTGLAGCGKTRFALQLAAKVLPQFQDGVYVVPLAPVTEAGNILWAIAERIKFQFQPQGAPLEQLLKYLHDKTLLLLLDNIEHLLNEVESLAEILQAAPRVKILVTSRERLNIYGETNYVIGGLELPDEDILENAVLAESVDLFLQRAKSVNPNLEMTADALHSIVRICHLVEGLPLGIELASTWVDVLPPREIASEIQRSLDILQTESRTVPHYQNSIRAAFARSWDSLNDTQRQAFRGLTVFRGGFTRNAARSVVGIELHTLQALVNKSLVRYNSEIHRYEIHELLRQYAHEQLESSGEAGGAYRAHAVYFANFMDEHWPEMKGSRQKDALLEVEADIENVRSAWNYWIREANVTQLKRFFHSFWVIYDIRGWYPAGIELFEQAVAVMRAVSNPEAETGLGWLLAAQGLYSVAGGGGSRRGFALAQQGIQILQRLNQRTGMVIPLMSLFITAIQVNEERIAVQAARDCLEFASELGDQWGIAKAKQLLAMRLIEDRNYQQAVRLGQEALVIFELSGDRWSESILCIELLGLLTITLGQFQEATAWIERGLKAAEAIEFKYSMQMAYWQLGYVEALRENYLKAGRYWHKALRVGERVVGGKSIIGFGGSSSSGEWGGREIIND
jgi:predicted ATPase/DNA-binding CsgD family transcriptional regulator